MKPLVNFDRRQSCGVKLLSTVHVQIEIGGVVKSSMKKGRFAERISLWFDCMSMRMRL
jgi:hypothetical protein